MFSFAAIRACVLCVPPAHYQPFPLVSAVSQMTSSIWNIALASSQDLERHWKCSSIDPLCSREEEASLVNAWVSLRRRLVPWHVAKSILLIKVFIVGFRAIDQRSRTNVSNGQSHHRDLSCLGFFPICLHKVS